MVTQLSASQPVGARMLRRWELPGAISPASARQTRPQKPLHLAYRVDRPALRNIGQKINPSGDTGTVPWSVPDSNTLPGISQLRAHQINDATYAIAADANVEPAKARLYGTLTEEGVDAELRRLTALLQGLLGDISLVHATVRRLRQHPKRTSDDPVAEQPLAVHNPQRQTLPYECGKGKHDAASSCIEVLTDAIGDGLADGAAAGKETAAMALARLEESLAQTLRRTEDLEIVRDETQHALSVLAHKVEVLQLDVTASGVDPCFPSTPPGRASTGGTDVISARALSSALSHRSGVEGAEDVISRAASACSEVLLEASQMTRYLMADVGLLDVEDVLPSYRSPFGDLA